MRIAARKSYVILDGTAPIDRRSSAFIGDPRMNNPVNTTLLRGGRPRPSSTASTTTDSQSTNTRSKNGSEVQAPAVLAIKESWVQTRRHS